MRKRSGGADRDRDEAGGGLRRGWRNASYAFVNVVEVESGANDAGSLLEVAIVGGRGEPDVCALMDMGGRVRWLAPRRPHVHEWSELHAQPPAEICPALRGLIRGRVVVVHGLGIGWRTLAATCSPLAPIAVLDSLALLGELLPAGDTSLAVLMERLDVRLTGAELRRAEVGESVRGAIVLARVFDRMVERTLPGASVADLVRLSGRHAHDPLPDIGLEGGP